jgi:hypothetical protein
MHLKNCVLQLRTTSHTCFICTSIIVAVCVIYWVLTHQIQHFAYSWNLEFNVVIHLQNSQFITLLDILHRQNEPVSAIVSEWSYIYEGIFKSFQTGHLQWELQMIQLSATRCNCIAILWVSLVSFATITLCVASQRLYIGVYIVVSLCLIIDSVWKLLDTPSYTSH